MNDMQNEYIEFLKNHIGELNKIIKSYEKTVEDLIDGIKLLEVELFKTENKLKLK